MMRNYLTFDFGTSFFSDQPVIVTDPRKTAVSIWMGLWTTLITYRFRSRSASERRCATAAGSMCGQRRHHRRLCGAGLSVRRPPDGAVRRRQLAVDFSVARLRQRQLGLALLADAHRRLFLAIALPITAFVISVRHPDDADQNCFFDEINKQYVLTARAKGLTERRCSTASVQECDPARGRGVSGGPGRHPLYRALLIEVIFSLDGLGLLGFDAAINRDYPIMFATLRFLPDRQPS